MNVWLLPSTFHPHKGGVEELTLQLALHLRAAGNEVLVVTNRHPSDLPDRDAVEGVNVVRLPFTAPRAEVAQLLRFPRELAGVIRALMSASPPPDVVHVQCASSQLTAAAIVARLKRVPMILTTQGEVAMDADHIFDESAYLRTMLRIASSSSSAVTACSRWAAERAASIAPAFAAATVVPNGVDPTQWEIGPIPDAPVVAAWGRHVAEKGFDLLLEAWPQVRRDLPAARLLLGGSGRETEKLKAMATQGVELLGPLDRAGVQWLLAASRIAVVPSRLEPFGIVALEAMATGRAVVWSTRGGLREATGGIGWAVDPTNCDALAHAIVQALAAQPEPCRYRRRAEQLSWPAICARYGEIYDRAIRSDGEKRPRRPGRIS